MKIEHKMMYRPDNAFSMTWLITETVIHGLIFKFFLTDYLRPSMLKWFSSLKSFKYIKKRSGALMKNMADEVPGLIVVGSYHTVG